MTDKTKIEWTDATWNPIRGCSRVSQGCVNCYAEGVARRFSGTGGAYEGLINKHGSWNGNIRFVDHLLDQPLRWARGRKIFVNSMSDLFHENVPFEYIAVIFWIMSVTMRHTYQVLTKRPERMLEFFRWVADYDGAFPDDRITDIAHAHPAVKALDWKPATSKRGGYDNCGPSFPYENVWLGVSVENQEAADERIPLLLQTPAAVRFLSCEPLLEKIDLRFIHTYKFRGAEILDALTGDLYGILGDPAPGHLPSLDWIIAGGESGHGARPMHPDWPRSLLDQCQAAGVPLFFKQWGEWLAFYKDSPCIRKDELTGSPIIKSDGKLFKNESIVIDAADGTVFARFGKKHAGRMLDGRIWDEFPGEHHDA